MFNKVQGKVKEAIQEAMRSNVDVQRVGKILEYILMGLCLIAAFLAFLIVILVSNVGGLN